MLLLSELHGLVGETAFKLFIIFYRVARVSPLFRFFRIIVSFLLLGCLGVHLNSFQFRFMLGSFWFILGSLGPNLLAFPFAFILGSFGFIWVHGGFILDSLGVC